MQEDDVFADILGMPKTKPKKKSAQKGDDDQFDFLERDIGAEMAALMGNDKNGKNSGAQTEQESVSKDQRNTGSMYDSDMIALRREVEL